MLFAMVSYFNSNCSSQVDILFILQIFLSFIDHQLKRQLILFYTVLGDAIRLPYDHRTKLLPQLVRLFDFLNVRLLESHKWHSKNGDVAAHA